MSGTKEYHAPVLLEEVLSLIPHKRDGVFLDGTLGGGGHFRAMAGRLDAAGTLIGLDRDPEAIAWSRDHLAPSPARIILEQARFSEVKRILDLHGISSLDGILIDLGVSSHQIDSPARGFSYLQQGELDMRMDPSSGITAAAFIRNSSEAELAAVLRDFGEVQGAGRIAAAIKAADARVPAITAEELRNCCANAASSTMSIKLLAKVFQALRIAVNDELGELRRFLSVVLDVLKVGGRLVVISYHSLEDRMVKEYMRENERSCICPPELPQCVCSRTPLFKRLTRRAVKASDAEVAANRRSRSARLRAIERIGVSR